MEESERKIAVRLGAAVRRGRTARGWSQAVLAERLDVSVDYVGLLERGERLPSLPALVRVAAQLDTTIAAMLGQPGEDPWIEEALVLLRAVPPGARDATLAMLRGVAASAVGVEATRRSRSGQKRR